MSCLPVCGDGYKIDIEQCEDGIKNDNKGCATDCLGPIDGWTCSGGDLNNPDVCNFICGDSKVVVSEVCDDGTNNNIGCATGCTGVHP